MFSGHWDIRHLFPREYGEEQTVLCYQVPCKTLYWHCCLWLLYIDTDPTVHFFRRHNIISDHRKRHSEIICIQNGQELCLWQTLADGTLTYARRRTLYDHVYIFHYGMYGGHYLQKYTYMYILIYGIAHVNTSYLTPSISPHQQREYPIWAYIYLIVYILCVFLPSGPIMNSEPP